jgi:hypothetical protein
MFAAWLVPCHTRLAARVPAIDWWETLWAALGLAVVVSFGVLLIWLVDRWRRHDREPLESPSGQMAHFQELFEKGEISQAELERIRGLLGKRQRCHGELSTDIPKETRPLDPPPAE